MDADGTGAAIAGECRRELGVSLDIGNLKIEPFSVSHDAADPVGFGFFHRHEKCALATDLGFVTATAQKGLAFADALVLEANHDVDLLKQGSYPWFLKQRILGSRGHLANTDAGWVAYASNGQAIRSTVAYEAGASYPEGGGTITFYQNGTRPEEGFCEIENVGPLKPVPAGQTLWLEQKLELLANVQITGDSADQWREAVEHGTL
jgi:hypothetical protein